MFTGHEEIRNELKLQTAQPNEFTVESAQWIEDVLRRAHQIHRQHGGFFGYDLEDWLQAEREMTDESTAIHFVSWSEPLKAGVAH